MTDTQARPTAVEAEAILSGLWERNYDPLTARLVGGLDLPSGARCLDLGAGAGSMARWLARNLDGSSVLAVDRDTTQLHDPQGPGVEVVRADVEELELAPATFDLVLARGVFSVLRDPERMLARAVDLLAPGGWLLYEDFYFLPAEDSPTEHGRAVISAYLRAFEAGGAHMRFARGVPARLARAGLVGIDTHIRPLGPGQGEWENELMRRRLELQGHPLVDQGWVEAADLARFVETLDQPESSDVTTLLFSTRGRRAGGAPVS